MTIDVSVLSLDLHDVHEMPVSIPGIPVVCREHIQRSILMETKERESVMVRGQGS
jgi:hypothetical protein